MVFIGSNGVRTVLSFCDVGVSVMVSRLEWIFVVV